MQSINGGEERQTVGLVARFSADRMFTSVKIRGFVIDAFVATDGGAFVLQAKAIRGYASAFSGSVSGFADSWEVTEAATIIPMPDERAYAISGVDGGIAVLRGNRIVSINQSGTWRTRIELLTIQGKESWRADVDWPVRQPAIDGGGGRVYVAGDRLAALDDGDTV